MAFLYVFIKLHVIIFNEVLNNKCPKTNPVVPSSVLAPESWCHCHWISTLLHMAEPYSKIGLTIVMYNESRVEEEE